MRWLPAALICLGVLLAPAPASAQQQSEEPTIRRAIESVLELDTWRGTTRLPRVSLDPDKGDLTVVFAMRRPLTDDVKQIVASATDDVFTILWAVYTSPDAERVQTTTVIGTYAVVGRYSRPRETPLLRAVLTADRAASFDWTSAAVADPSVALDTWWVEGELVASAPAH